MGAHISRESRHRDFAPSEFDLLENDLVKRRRWRDQIRARDYFSAEAGMEAEDVLTECRAALDSLRASTPSLVATAR